MMIVILWAALVLAVLIVCLNVATLVAAWPMLILAVLILALDRRGPACVAAIGRSSPPGERSKVLLAGGGTWFEAGVRRAVRTSRGRA
jgi:hypothetical protein